MADPVLTDWGEKSVLVTGAGGFIGSHLTERLVALGARTQAFVHYRSTGSWGWLDYSSVKSDVEVVAADIADVESVREAFKGVDVVFHLAALIGIPYSYRAPRSYVRTNLEGTLNVLQSALESDVSKVIVTSTSEVYGTARYVPIDEEHPLQAQSPYSASKIAADKLAESFSSSFGLPVAVARPFNTYGPRQSARAVIPTIISQALTQGEIQLGSLEPTRDFNFVEDTVDGFIKIAESENAVGQVVNIGSGVEVSIRELTDMVCEVIGKKCPVVTDQIRIRPAKSEVTRLCADNTRARELIGWEPKTTLRQGLVHTVQWIEERIEEYRPEFYAV